MSENLPEEQQLPLGTAIVNKLLTNTTIVDIVGSTGVRRQDGKTKVTERSQRHGIFFLEQYSRPMNEWDNCEVEDMDIEFIFSHSNQVNCYKLVDAFKFYWKDRTVPKPFRYFDPSDDRIRVLDSDITVDWGVKFDTNLQVYEGRVVMGIRWHALPEISSSP